MEQLDKYHQAVADSKVSADDAAVKAAVDELLAKHAAENMNDEVYRFIFNSIDRTTLNSTDSPASVARFTDRVNAFENEYPDLPPVAAICVYPNMV
ncbi:MAG: deoxyribose-phosphate aldolase, partial [Muribaculaceae bacterium]|nr:deoxyribose-phosphate aldolase [Muribaculaceae bacterium]